MWDACYPGGSYDAVRRRSGQQPAAAGPARPASAGLARAQAVAHQEQSPKRTKSVSAARPIASAGQGSGAQEKQVAELKKALEEMERERDFYFGKLRDIEILTQRLPTPDSELYKEVTKILYATEEGFEIPDGQALAISSSCVRG